MGKIYMNVNSLQLSTFAAGWAEVATILNFDMIFRRLFVYKHYFEIVCCVYFILLVCYLFPSPRCIPHIAG